MSLARMAIPNLLTLEPRGLHYQLVQTPGKLVRATCRYVCYES